ncbi:hypothetical protein GEMRC1_009226 [Eukaryota sp. GEM-RC1]
MDTTSSSCRLISLSPAWSVHDDDEMKICNMGCCVLLPTMIDAKIIRASSPLSRNDQPLRIRKEPSHYENRSYVIVYASSVMILTPTVISDVFAVMCSL